MLETDLNGLWLTLKNNQMFHLFILLGICIILYMMLSKYMKQKNNFDDINCKYCFLFEPYWFYPYFKSKIPPKKYAKNLLKIFAKNCAKTFAKKHFLL